MAKNSIRDYANTAASNTDVQSINIDEGCAPSGINNAIREVMADLADVNDGTIALETPVADSLSVTGNITVGGTVDGRDVATDGTKLDGIEAGATADQTSAEISAALAGESPTVDTINATTAAITGAITGASAAISGALTAATINGHDTDDFLKVTAESLLENGYVKLSNGLLIQWGRKVFTTSGGTLTWNTPFTTACFIAMGTDITNANSISNLADGTIGTSSWTGIDVGSNATFAWIAIGV